MIHPRWRSVLAVTPYVVLGLLVLHTLIAGWAARPQFVPTLILCAAVAVWIFVFRDLPIPSRERPALVGVFMAGLIVLNLLLVLRDGWFGFLTIATYSFAYSLVRWPWRLFAIAATGVTAGLAQASSLGDDARVAWTIGIIAINIVVMCGLAWGLHLSQQQLERATVEAERSRLAREIHDTLAQGFAGIVTQLQAAEQAPDDGARRRHTDAALALARDGITEARRSVQALRPAALDTARLAGAIENVARAWSERTGIPVEITLSGDGRALPLDVEVALLRTAQEALANVERHANAHRVVLSLRSTADRVRLEVHDDGRGFDARRQQSHNALPEEAGGYGLVAMRERVESVAGEFVVDSHPGHGTGVRAEVRV
jgi:signal transduction histidine kinase